MPIYTAIFLTANLRATDEIEADTAELALHRARELAEHDSSQFEWYPFDPSAEVEDIEIQDADENLDVTWQSDDLRLRLARFELFQALTDLVSQIDSLTGESSCIDEDIRQGDAYQSARAALAAAKPLPD